MEKRIYILYTKLTPLILHIARHLLSIGEKIQIEPTLQILNLFLSFK